eukprot:1157555-Pelagomonas_calceolata.AAC.4
MRSVLHCVCARPCEHGRYNGRARKRGACSMHPPFPPQGMSMQHASSLPPPGNEHAAPQGMSMQHASSLPPPLACAPAMSTLFSGWAKYWWCFGGQ